MGNITKEFSIEDSIEYPKTVEESRWIDFLRRDLEPFEKEILHDVAREIMFNKEKMRSLHAKLIPQGFCIPILTSLNGNCFFESLAYHGIGSNSSTIRRAIAYLMYQFKDYKNLIPGQDLSLGELFEMELYDQISYVFCKKRNKLYKNTYEIMCLDLASSGSWSILPTNLIMLLISRLFYIRFLIIKDTDEKDTNFRTVDAFENISKDKQLPMKDIRLAHILESHFLPIDLILKNNEVLYYKEAKKRFHLWGTDMQKNRQSFIENKKQSMDNRFGGFLDFVNIA